MRWDMDLAATVGPSQGWMRWIDEAIRDSDAVVFLISKAPSRSGWLRHEGEAGLLRSYEKQDFRLLPVLDPGVEPPAFLRDRVFLRSPDGDWAALAPAIAAALAGPSDSNRALRTKAANERKAWAEQLGVAIASRVQAEKTRHWRMNGLAPEDCVVINCPFDDAYAPSLRALVLGTVCCGFTPRSALDGGRAGRLRFERI